MGVMIAASIFFACGPIYARNKAQSLRKIKLRWFAAAVFASASLRRKRQRADLRANMPRGRKARLTAGAILKGLLNETLQEVLQREITECSAAAAYSSNRIKQLHAQDFAQLDEHGLLSSNTGIGGFFCRWSCRLLGTGAVLSGPCTAYGCINSPPPSSICTIA